MEDVTIPRPHELLTRCCLPWCRVVQTSLTRRQVGVGAAVTGVFAVAFVVRRMRPQGRGLDVVVTLLATMRSLFGNASDIAIGDAVAAEDAFYVHEYGGKDPMIGMFWFTSASEAEFKCITDVLAERLRKFLAVEYWSSGLEPTDSDTVAAEVTSTALSERDIWCDLVVLRHHVETRCVTLVLNHARVGGGDYLRLGCQLWNSQASDLVALPRSRALIAYCVVRSVLDVLVGVTLGHGGRLLRGPTRRYRGRFTCDQEEGVGRRFVAAARLLAEVSRCTGWESFHVIFPVGISKDGAHGVANAVGAARVRYVAGMTPARLYKALQNKWYWVPATGFYSTRVKGSKSSSSAGAFARSMADVVCTIASFRRQEGADVTRALTEATGTTHTMKFYPIYLWGMVEDSVCHWGATVVSEEFQLHWSEDSGAHSFQL